jgi:hypothetical protein
MENIGFITLHRKLMDSKVFANETALKIWIWCLLSANHKEAHVSEFGSIVTVKRGQFITGRFRAESQLNINGKTWYKWMKFFESEKMITLNSSNKNTLVTICNYDTYQGKNLPTVATVEQQRYNSGTTAVQQRSTNNNDNNNNNEKNDNKARGRECDFPLDESEIQTGRSHYPPTIPNTNLIVKGIIRKESFLNNPAILCWVNYFLTYLKNMGKYSPIQKQEMLFSTFEKMKDGKAVVASIRFSIENEYKSLIQATPEYIETLYPKPVHEQLDAIDDFVPKDIEEWYD